MTSLLRCHRRVCPPSVVFDFRPVLPLVTFVPGTKRPTGTVPRFSCALATPTNVTGRITRFTPHADDKRVVTTPTQGTVPPLPRLPLGVAERGYSARSRNHLKQGGVTGKVKKGFLYRLRHRHKADRQTEKFWGTKNSSRMMKSG